MSWACWFPFPQNMQKCHLLSQNIEDVLFMEMNMMIVISSCIKHKQFMLNNLAKSQL